MANGFQTSRPSRQGSLEREIYAGWCWGQRFTCPGTGTIEISEIGLYAKKSGAAKNIQLAIMTHDAANNCPEAIVSNSQTPNILVDGAQVQAEYYTYGTKPQLTGGNEYWPVWISEGTIQFDYADATGINGVNREGETFPTIPTGDTWHSHTDRDTYDAGVYMVYSTGGTALVKLVDETEQLSEARQSNLGLRRFLGETEQVSEGVVRRSILRRIVAETQNIAEGVLRRLSLTRTANEAENISENVQRRSALGRIINETLNISEGVLKFISTLIVKVVNETLSISEGVLKYIGKVRVVNETLNVAEGILRRLSLMRAINETEQVAEGVVRRGILRRIVAEALNIAENVLRRGTLIRIVNESLSIIEGVVSKLFIPIKFIKALFNFKAPSMSFSLRTPSTSFNIKTPSMEFDITES